MSRFLLSRLSICVFALLLLGTKAIAQNNSDERLIYWLHGLNERNYVFWYRYDSLFATQYKISPYLRAWDLLYYSTGSIDSIAQLQLYPRMRLSMLDKTTSPTYRPIFICHSMGGLVARQMVKTLSNNPALDIGGGIITVGTPNNGAAILTSLQSPLLDVITARHKDELLAPFPFINGTISILVATISGALSYVDPLNLIDSLSFQPISRVRQVLDITGASGDFGALQRCTQDMIPGSTFLQSLNDGSTFPPTVPTISLYGAAKWQSHLRLLSSITQQDPTLYPIDAAPDNYWVRVANSLSKWYRANGLHELSAYTTLLPLLTQVPLSVIEAEAHKYFAGQYFRAANYVDYGSQIDWAALIKAQTLKTATYNAAIANSSGVDTPSAWQEQVTLTHSLVKENDGLLSKETQNLQGAQKQYQAKGANHFTEGNHSSVRTRINQILLSEQGFITLPK